MSIPFAYRAGRLACDRVSLTGLADVHGTPLYVYSATAIRGRFRLFDRSFRALPHTLCYSVKANSNLALLSLLGGLGAGFDVVSGGELERVLRAHMAAAARIVFSGVGKTAEEMDAALRAGILLFNVESESELDLLAVRAARLRKRAAIALRVNPDVPAETHPYISTGLREHKFGVPIDDAERLYALAAGHTALEVAGVSVHIGSQITNPEPFAAAMERVAALVRSLRRSGHRIRYVDAGGGLGITYQHPSTPGESGPDFNGRIASYARAVLTPLRKLNVHLLLEPGRSIVGPAGALIARVLYVKQNGAKRFIVLDAAMNDLIRPSLYGAYHEILPVRAPGSPPVMPSDAGQRQAEPNPYRTRKAPGTRAQRASDSVQHAALSSVLGTRQSQLAFDVVGPICETGDFFARDRQLPTLAEGDLIAILDAGAYGMSLASNYNTRGRAAEVLVDGASSRLIRRRETIADILRQEET